MAVLCGLFVAKGLVLSVLFALLSYRRWVQGEWVGFDGGAGQLSWDSFCLRKDGQEPEIMEVGKSIIASNLNIPYFSQFRPHCSHSKGMDLGDRHILELPWQALPHSLS